MKELSSYKYRALELGYTEGDANFYLFNFILMILIVLNVPRKVLI